MNEETFRLAELAQQGLCCSQALVQMGLDARGEKNPDLIRTLWGLCVGMRSGDKPCGALSGGVCLLSLYLGKGGPDETERDGAKELVRELVHWFGEEYGGRYGGTDCMQLLEGTFENAPKRCPGIILSVYGKAVELLTKAGIGLDGTTTGDE